MGLLRFFFSSVESIWSGVSISKVWPCAGVSSSSRVVVFFAGTKGKVFL